MRIGCLQFAPQVGDIDNNLNRADAVLNRADPDNLDLLVLPELAFSGYNFKSLQEITPFLEHSASGISSLWARTMALKYDCTVVVGYPEKVDPTPKWPTGPEYYNAAIVVNGDGETVANYRKTHLFRTDETWALENPSGFYNGFLVGLGNTAIGICMDLNPYKFEAPWHAFEFAFHVLEMEANLVIVSMAWMTTEDGRLFSRMPQEPDMDTLMYWVTRLEPIIRSESDDEVIVVFANRTGIEGEAVYAGTSAVMGIKGGEVRVYGILGRGVKDLLIVDTNMPPYARLVYRPDGQRAGVDGNHAQQNEPMPQQPRSSQAQRGAQEGVGSPAKSGSSDGSVKSSSNSNQSQGSRGSRGSSKSRPKPKKKLSLQTDAKTLHRGMADDPSIRTPTCPSPTPIALRPRLTIPPAESLTMKYLESQCPTPHPGALKASHADDMSSKMLHPKNSTPYPVSAAHTEPIRILGGHVTITHESDLSASPSRQSFSQFCDLSPESPRLYWVPPSRMLKTPIHGLDWTPAADSDVTHFSDATSAISRSNANSVLSNRYYPVSNPQTALPRSRAQSVDIADIEKSKSTSLSGTEPKAEPETKSGKEQVPDRPSSPKSRNASRNRGVERSESSMGSKVNLGFISQKLDEMAQRVDSSQGQYMPWQGRQFGIQSAQAHMTNSDYEEMRALSISQQSIPISLWKDRENGKMNVSADGVGSHGLNQKLEATSYTPETRQRSDSNHNRGRNVDRPASRASHHSQTSTPGDKRTISRGRQPSSRNQKQKTPSRSHGGTGSRSHNHPGSSVAAEPIDLSQFNLIEEYTSPDCPLHGARSESAAQNHNDQEPQQRVPRDSPRTSPPARRVQNPNSARMATEEPSQPVGSTTPSSSTRKEQNASVSIESLTSNSPSPKSPFEPQTPKAMLLVYDMKSAPIPEMGLKCVEKPADLDASRPKSAIW